MQNRLLDIVKFLACLFVVAIHKNPFGVYGEEVVWFAICFCRWAVPFFFVSSSYLFWKKGKKYSVYAKRLLILLVLWMLIYSFYIIPKYSSVQNGGLLFLFGLCLGNTFESSWYLTASIEAMGLVWLLRKWNNGVLLIIGSLLYLICLAYSIYYPSLSQTFDLSVLDGLSEYFKPTNSFFSAFVFIVLGKIVAEQKELFSKYRKQILIGLVVSVIIGVMECVLFVDTSRWVQDALFCLPVFAFCLTSLISQSNIKIPLSDQFCKFLRNSSILVYLGHHLFIYLCETFHHKSDWKAYFFVVFCSLLFAYLVQFVSKRIKVLKYLY